MKNFDADKFVAELLKQHWEHLFFAEDPNSMWEIWNKRFLEVLNNKHAHFNTKLGFQAI